MIIKNKARVNAFYFIYLPPRFLSRKTHGVSLYAKLQFSLKKTKSRRANARGCIVMLPDYQRVRLLPTTAVPQSSPTSLSGVNLSYINPPKKKTGAFRRGGDSREVCGKAVTR